MYIVSVLHLVKLLSPFFCVHICLLEGVLAGEASLAELDVKLSQTSNNILLAYIIITLHLF